MAAELIGPARCPLCSGRARLSLAKSKLTVLTCNGCNCQIFARSDRSDEALRARLLPADKDPAPAAPVPAPAAPAPAPAATPAIPPLAAPVPVRTEKAGLRIGFM